LLLVNANGTVVNANAIALETFETPGTALVGRGLLDLLPSFDPKRIPGSMRSPREAADDTRTKPTRMTARRTDGSEFPVQVTSANLEDGRTPYADYGDGVPHYTGDELLMLVVRDLSGTVDTEAELARQQRQTEMILRAAAEGVVGVDTAGKVVLVNPSAAQILGYRATDLGGKELHPLVHHSRPDGSPLAYEETPLADTLRSGRKHRVRGQVLWRKDGKAVPVDLTTAPVRDGDQLVGAVMTFTDRTVHDAMSARNEQLRALLDSSLRGPLAQLHGELTGLAADPAGQLWPEANQILHHLAAGYSRISTLIANVLDFQRLDRGEDKLHREAVGMDDVLGAAVEGAVELIGPGRAQFAVHAAPVRASVDGPRLATALAHLIADVAGVDSTGNSVAFAGDSTIVVAAAQRGEVVRIDVRGPSAGGDAVHLPLARGVIERHGGVLQTHDVPGQGSAYVLEVPLGLDPEEASAQSDRPAEGRSGGAHSAGRRGRGGAHSVSRGTTAAPTPEGEAGPAEPPAAQGDASGQDGGAGPQASEQPYPQDTGTVVAPWAVPPAGQADAPTGRRRALRRPDDAPETSAAEAASLEAAGPAAPTGRRGRRGRPAPEEEGAEVRELPAPRIPNALPPAGAPPEPDDRGGAGAAGTVEQPKGTGRRARRPLEAAPPPVQPVQPAPTAPTAQPLPSAEPVPPVQPMPPAQPVPPLPGMPYPPEPPHASHASQASQAPQPPRAAQAPQVPQPPQPAQTWPQAGGAAAASETPHADAAPVRPEGPAQPPATWPDPERPQPQPAATQWPSPGGAPAPALKPALPGGTGGHGGTAARAGSVGGAQGAQGHPGAGDTSQQTYGRAISVRALGQGALPFGGDPAEQTPTQAAHAQHPNGLPAQVAAGGSGRRRRLAAPQDGPSVSALPLVPSQPNARPAAAPVAPGGDQEARQHPQADPDSGQLPVRRPGAPSAGDPETALLRPVPAEAGPRAQGGGRAYAIGAPAAGAAEGPEPLDGPNGAVDVTDTMGQEAVGAGVDPRGGFGAAAGPGAVPEPRAAVDDRPDAPLDEPRRLLVWPEPDVSTRQALTDRGYRPVIVRSREEVDAQVAEPPAALFVDPLTGPITRTALQSLRQAAAAAEVPVLVTAGLGQATREAAYGADPAVLLKALAPRDSDQHPPRVLLVEGHEPIAAAFSATLERRGMQVTHADSESDAMTKAAQMHPNLVVMDLMLIRRRRQGIVDWLRGNGRLDATPLVVYTSADIDPDQLPRLASGETVLFLAERSTSPDVQSRIVDLLGKIGA